MSGQLPPHARRKLLDAAAPLADAPDDPLVAGADVDLARYRIVRELGRGGMGVVYEAVDLTLDRRVALKVLTGTAGMGADARARFLREAQAAARLSHPNIAAVYDATPEAIAMQLIEGRTLGEERWDDARALSAVLRDAALAVHAAHQQGIVHRDLKPANLMVERARDRGGVGPTTPHVYVMDFGLAKETAVDSSLSTSGSILGTPAYMSPEQAAGRTREVDARSDVYALGATLYDCLAGHAPFAERHSGDGSSAPGPDVYQLIRRTVEEEPEPLERAAPGVDRELATIAAKCLAKEPDRRYPSALALASDLDRWLRGEPIEARPASLAYRLRKYLSRRSGAIKAGAILATIAAGLVALIVVPPAMEARAAREAAEEALALSGRISQALADSKVLARSGDMKSANARLDEGLTAIAGFLSRTETPHARFFEGTLLRARGRPREARAALDRALADAPDLFDAHFERGLLLAEMRRDMMARRNEPGFDSQDFEAMRTTALADLETALAGDRDGQSARAHYAAGHRAWLAGDTATAERELKAAARIETTHSQAHLSLSVLYLERGDDGLGLRHSVIYTDLERGFGRAYDTRLSGECYSIAGIEGLVYDFSSGGGIRPGTPQAHCARAQIQMGHAASAETPEEALRAWDAAVSDLDFAIELDPRLAGAWLNRAVCHHERDKRLIDTGDTVGAVAARRNASIDLGEAILLDEQLGPVWFSRALLHKRMGMLLWMAQRPAEAELMWDSARGDVERALERMPERTVERDLVETQQRVLAQLGR